MCINKRWIYNSRLKQSLYCDCGKCEPCQQVKADKRVTRINNEWLSHSGLMCYMVELDYSNENVPYVLKSDVDSFLSDPHNRDIFIYRNNKTIQVLTPDDFVRTSVPDFSKLSLNPDYLQECVPFRHSIVNKVGVLYKPDIQRFFKRFKINLVRAGYKGYMSYFYCSDYGGKYKRPHFHFLVYFEKKSAELVSNILRKSWPFTDLFESRRQSNGYYKCRIEVARNPANYVASYVNCTTFVSSFLSQTIPFKPMYHFSNGFGCNFSEFSISSLLEKTYRGTPTYRRKTIVGGVCVESDVLIPKYIISRYFPRFKGFSRLSSDEICRLAVQPRKYLMLYKRRLELTLSDVDLITTKLVNIRQKICKLDDENDFYRFLHSWAFCYSRIWPLYYSWLHKVSWNDVRSENDVFEHFDNIKQYFLGGVRCDYLDSLNYDNYSEFMANKNSDSMLFDRSVVRNIDLIKRYRRQKHHHDINNLYYE